MQKTIIKRGAIGSILGLLLPLASSAQVPGSTKIDTILTQIRNSLNTITVILFALITIYFIWGVIQYVTSGGDDEKLGKGKKHMLYGIIGLAVVGAAWALAGVVMEYLGVTAGGNKPTPPSF